MGGVKLQAGSSLISGCGEGGIKVWDIRKQSSLHTWDTGNGIISFDIHATCPLVSMAHSNGQLSLYSTLDGKMVNIIKQQQTRVLTQLSPSFTNPQEVLEACLTWEECPEVCQVPEVLLQVEALEPDQPSKRSINLSSKSLNSSCK